LYYLQVLSSHQYTHLAAQNQTRQVADPAPRGLILDRGGKPLVADQTTEVITLARQAATNHPKVVGRLAQVLHMSSAQVKAQLNNNQYSPYRPVPIKSGVPATTVVYLAEHQAQFPGVSSQLEAQRSYPYGPTAAQLLGYTGAISATELKKLRSKGYRAGDQVGKSGVEASFERWLHGQPGMTKLSVDAKGTVVGTVSHKAPVPGDNVQLSLDLGLQKTAGKALANEIHSLQGKVIPGTGGLTAQAPAGAAVVLNPENGAILASASYPTYNPSVWVGGISGSAYKTLTAKSSQYPLLNRVTQGLYTPGSTFKLATATAALKTGLITPSTPYNDTGTYHIPGKCTGKCTYHDAGGEVLGPLTVTGAIAKSSDDFFYNLGVKFYFQSPKYGPTPIQNTAHAYGLGQATGVKLPDEYNGRIDSPAERKKLHALAPKVYPKATWYPADNLEMAFGQGQTVVTPLQLANAYATFANGGTRYQPRVAAQVVSPAGKVVKASKPVVTGHVALSPADHQALLDGFVGAVQRTGGTAYNTFKGFNFSKLDVAGKTGTATTGLPIPTALFVAFAGKDIHHPQYVVAVVIEQAGYGAAGAAPVARQILQYLSDHPLAPVATPRPPASATVTPSAPTTTTAPTTTSTTTPPATTTPPTTATPSPATTAPATTATPSPATTATTPATLTPPTTSSPVNPPSPPSSSTPPTSPPTTSPPPATTSPPATSPPTTSPTTSSPPTTSPTTTSPPARSPPATSSPTTSHP
ncbi:MAG: penicillin-binding protein 2, partial [Acidimicrobiales bacterium]